MCILEAMVRRMQGRSRTQLPPAYATCQQSNALVGEAVADFKLHSARIVCWGQYYIAVAGLCGANAVGCCRPDLLVPPPHN